MDSTYRILVGRALDVQGPYLDRAGRAMTRGGGTLVLAGYDDCRGPGHNAVLSEGERSWLVHHMYDAANEGTATLQVRPLIWADDGWPLPGEPLGQGAAPDRPEPPRPIAGRWIYSVDFENPQEIRLTPSGGIEGGAGGGTWDYDGRVLSLLWGAPPDPVRIHVCFLDPGQAVFVGRNPKHRLVRGVRERPDP